MTAQLNNETSADAEEPEKVLDASSTTCRCTAKA